MFAPVAYLPVVLTLAALVLGPGPVAGPVPVAESFAVMGTEATLTIWTSDAPRAKRAFADARAELDRLERLMTDWERPGWAPSDVVRINQAAGKRAVKVDTETLEVIEKALDMSRRSAGAFDVTFAAMKGLWKFDEDLDPKVP